VRIIVDIGHPAHVHFFKNFVWEMRARGHEILITASKKEVTSDLLKAYNFDYIFTCKRYSGVGFAYELMKRDAQMFNLARRFKPDVITGIHNTIAAHVSRVTRAKSIIFTDTEHARLANMVTFPFADVFCTPSCFRKDLGKKQVKYNGCHELAYLHPNYFKPDPSVLDDLGLKEGDKFVVVRFVAWQASHDVGQHGFNMETKRKLVKELEKCGRVLITSESPLPSEFEKYKITAPPERIHDLLYYATMYIGEGGTMATEAAILGTPAVLINPEAELVGIHKEFRDKYGLLYFYSTASEALKGILGLLKDKALKSKWQEKRGRLLADKIDVTQFMVDFIENYPQSFYRYKEESRNQL